MEFYAHDGTDWRKAKHVYGYDGTAWRKAKEIWAADPNWRCVYQDREFVERNAPGFSVVSCLRKTSSGDLLASTDIGVYLYSGGSWSRIGGVTAPFDAIEISGTYYYSSFADVFRWTGATWTPAGSTTLSDIGVLGVDGSGRLLALEGGGFSSYTLIGSTWTAHSVTLESTWLCPANGICYGIDYVGNLYNVDTAALVASSPTFGFPAKHVYAQTASDIFIDGTDGLWQWNGSTWTRWVGADYRLCMAEYDSGEVLGMGSFARKLTRHAAISQVAPVGDQTLVSYWTNWGKPTAALIGSTLYVLINRTSPTRTTVSEFSLK